jgi:hypothetical protein
MERMKEAKEVRGRRADNVRVIDDEIKSVGVFRLNQRTQSI